MEFVKRKRVTVCFAKRTLKDGTISKTKLSSILNFPEEEIGTTFFLKLDEEGFTLEQHDNGGIKRVVRKSSGQTIITLGDVSDVSTEFDMYKTDTGYKFIKCENIKKGYQHNIYEIKKHKWLTYICLSKYHLQNINPMKLKYFKVTEYYKPYYKMTIEATNDMIEENVNGQSIRYIRATDKNKTIYITKEAIEQSKLDTNNDLLLYYGVGKINLIAHPAE